MARTVYVLGGYRSHGGSFLLYTTGRILFQHFGYTCRIVCSSRFETPERSIYTYPERFDQVTLDTLQKEMKSTDLLVLGAAASEHCFGLRLPGKKLMCINGYNTFSVLDGFCDYYVCNSVFVQRFIKLVYGFSPPVIPRFIHLEKMPSGMPWRRRPAAKILVHGKWFFTEMLEDLRSRLKSVHPSLKCELVTTRPKPHHEFLLEFVRYRYFLPLSACEGFGLIPLEAMACGCTVVGFHGNGGLEYMRPGINCEVARYPQLDLLADKVAGLIAEPKRAEALASQGLADSQGYDYPRAEARWIRYLSENVVRP